MNDSTDRIAWAKTFIDRGVRGFDQDLTVALADLTAAHKGLVAGVHSLSSQQRATMAALIAKIRDGLELAEAIKALSVRLPDTH
jgi:hypothetical protein